MLFNSQIFLLAFLPLTLVLYYLASSVRAVREWLLIIASVAFYGYWEPRLVVVLLGSIAINWLFALSFRGRRHHAIVTLGIVLNLIVIGIFKYADFFADTLAWLLDFQHQPWNIMLPLGISFFTFQQISYLADRSRGKAPMYGFREYFLYVAFFPQLIAGPIIRHNEFIYQLVHDPKREGLHERLSRGVTLLTIGLVKKVAIADQLGRLCDPLFEAASHGSLSFIDAWVAALAFSFQIYFDFSGYSDMAIGLALMFGFVLPINFDSPYRATTIQDFWRRWHMTLSHFLRDYLYIPMGGNRHGPVLQAAALMGTMFLGGLWHGAGWTFVAWGMMHGVALAGHAVWARFKAPLPGLAAWALTVVFLVGSWVLFRAENFSDAMSVLTSMSGGHGIDLVPSHYTVRVRILAIAAVVALIGPTSHGFALNRDYARPWVAVAVAMMLAWVVLEVGSQPVNDFIYFQF